MVAWWQWHSRDALVGSAMGTEVGIAGTGWARVCVGMAGWGRGGGDGEGFGGDTAVVTSRPVPYEMWCCGIWV